MIDLNTVEPDWVVTYKVEFETSSHVETLISEFYRGERSECLRILGQFGAGSHDRRKTSAWFPIAGPAHEWDAFLEDN